MRIHELQISPGALFLAYGIGALLLFLGQTAEAVTIDPLPEDENQRQSLLRELTNDLTQAQCGGWLDQTVGDTPGIQIARVTGAPGRDGAPLEQIPLGMAKRDEESGFFADGFVFPTTQTSRGWSTACRMEDLVGTNFPEPERLQNCQNPQDCQQLCIDLNMLQRQVCLDGDTLLPKQRSPCYFNTAGGEGLNVVTRQEATPTCQVGDFIAYEYCCAQAGNWFNIVEDDDFTRMDTSHIDQNRNCIQCRGDGATYVGEDQDYNGEILDRDVRNETGCRWGHQVADPVPAPRPILPDTQVLPYPAHRQYWSFYRQYNVSYERQPLTPSDDSVRQGVPVSCYGFYEEFDPKLKAVQNGDRRCTIDVFSNPQHSLRRMPQTQAAVGSYGEGAPDTYTPEVRGEDEPWYTPESQAFTLLDSQILREEYENRLSGPLGNLDIAEVKATHQVRPPADQGPDWSGAPFLTVAGRMRATDDTVADSNQKRTIVEWWQAQQTEASKLRPARVTLLLPSSWPLGYEALRPLIDEADAEEALSAEVGSPLQESIEVQLSIQDDLVSEVAAFFERSLLMQIEEEPLYAVIPLGSATEFRAIAEGWCHWYRVQSGEADCNTAPAEVGDLITRLQEYADQIDQYRSLRSEMTRLMTRQLQVYEQINRLIVQWIGQSQIAYDSYSQENEEVYKLRERWRQVQRVYRAYHDDANFPWCRSDRFTTPIYSLLDPWLPGRPGLSGDSLPSLSIQRSSDLVFDFSWLSFSAEPLRLPVLQPVQVSLDFETIRQPAPQATEVDVPTLPQLPEFTNVTDDLVAQLTEFSQDIDQIDPPLPAFEPTPINYAGVEQTMGQIGTILNNMYRAYARFWDVLLNDAIQNSRQAQACYVFGEDQCYFTEMDLHEVFRRIGARPGIQLREDFASVGEPRRLLHPDDVCNPTDWACQLMNPEYDFPTVGWEIQVPTNERQQELYDALRRHIYEQTVRESNLPYAVEGEELLPSLDVPADTVLSPESQEPAPNP